MSRLAIAGLVLSILGFCTVGLAAIPGLILGICGLAKIRRSGGGITGRGVGVAAIIVGSSALLLATLSVIGAVLWWAIVLRPPDMRRTGGYTLRCDVEVGSANGSAQLLNDVAGALKGRLDPGGLLGITIRPVSASQLEIAVPVRPNRPAMLDDPANLIDLLRGAGVLEFRIAPTPGAFPDAEQYREGLRRQGPQAGANQPYGWYVIDKPADFFDRGIPPAELRTLPGETADQREQRLAQRIADTRGLIGQPHGNAIYILLSNSADDSLTRAQPDWKLQNVGATSDSNGYTAVAFSMNPAGARHMANLTGTHIGKPMAIVLDDRVMSAPIIQSRISDRGIITGGMGGFDRKELDYLLRALEHPLPVPVHIDPATIQRVPPATNP